MTIHKEGQTPMKKPYASFLLTLIKSIIPFAVLYALGLFIAYIVLGRLPSMDGAFYAGVVSTLVFNAHFKTSITKVVTFKYPTDERALLLDAAKKSRLKIIEEVPSRKYLIKTSRIERLYAHDTTITITDQTMVLIGPRYTVNKLHARLVTSPETWNNP